MRRGPLRRPCLLLAAALLASGAATRAAGPQTATPVAALVERLGAADFAEREAAQAALLERGPAESVLKALEAAAASPDAEVRRRAAAVRGELDRYAEGAKLLTARTATLKFDAVPLDKAVVTLRKLTGANLLLAAGQVATPGRPVTVTTGELPAWEAVEAFRKAAGLVEVFREDAPPPSNGESGYPAVRRSYYGGNQPPAPTANLIPVQWADAPAVGTARPAELAADRRGPVRVTAMPARFAPNRVIRGAGQVLIHLDLTPPADLRWERTDEVRLTRAEDETTRPVTVAHALPPPTLTDPNMAMIGGMVFNNYAYGQPAGDQGNPRLAPLTLKTDDRLVTRLRVLEGVVLGTVSLPNQPVFTIGDLSKGVGKPLDGPNDTRLTLQGYETKPGGGVTIRLAIEGPNPWAQARFGGNRAAPAVNLWDENGLGNSNLKNYHFTDAAGRPVKMQVTSSSASDNGVRQSSTMELTCPANLDKSHPPVRLTVVGDRPVTVAVPFKLRDVPLP
jgi:hypothetical protein